MPSSIRFFADLHLHEWREGAVPVPKPKFGLGAGCNSRLHDQVSAFVVAAQAVAADSAAVFCGDLVHSRAGATPDVVRAAGVCLRAMTTHSGAALAIPGNHDHAAKRGGGDYLTALTLDATGHAVEIGDAPKLVTRTLGKTTVEFALVPWLADPEEFREAVRYLANAYRPGGIARRILVAHQGIKGARLNDAVFSRHAEIALNDLLPDAWDFVALGDYHLRQQLAPNVWYVGSFCAHNWGDANEAKGFLDLDLETMKVSFGASSAPSYLSFEGDKLAEVREFLALQKKARKKGERDIVRVVVPRSCKVDPEEAEAAGALLAFLPDPVDEDAEAAPEPDAIALDSPVPAIVDHYLDAMISRDGCGPNGDEAMDWIESAKEVLPSIYAAVDPRSAPPPVSLRLLWVEAENFLSYERLDRVPLDNQGVVFLDGRNEDDPSSSSNGAGKSALIEAVLYGLFGRTSRLGVRVQGLRRRWAKRGEQPVARVAIATPAGVLVVERGQKAGLNLSLDGRDATPANRKEADAALASYLGGVDFDLFRRLCLLDSGASLVDLGDAGRREALESLSGGQRFAPYHRAARDLAAAEADQAARIRQSKERTSADAEAARRVLASEEGASATFAQTLAARVADVEANAKQAELDLAEKKAEIKKLRAASKLFDPRLLADLREKRAAAERAREQGLELVREAASSRDLAAHELAAARKDLAAARTGGGVCRTCRRPMGASASAAALSKLQARVDDLEKRLADADKAASSEEVETALATLAADVRKASDELQAELAKKARVESDGRRIEDAERAAASLAERVASLRAKAKEVAATPDPHVAKIAKARAEAADLDARAAELGAKLNASLKRSAGLSAAVDVFSPRGARGHLIAGLAPAIEKEANSFLAAASGGALSVRFRYDFASEKTTLEADNALGAVDLDGNSGGQRRRLAIALTFALHRQVRGQVGVLFVDEAFDALDAEASARVAAYLGSAAADSLGTVVVVSHRPELASAFPRVWTATFRNGKSTLDAGAAK